MSDAQTLSSAEMEMYRQRVLAGEYIEPELARRIIATLREGRHNALAATKAKRERTAAKPAVDEAAAEADLDGLLDL